MVWWQALLYCTFFNALIYPVFTLFLRFVHPFFYKIIPLYRRLYDKWLTLLDRKFSKQLSRWGRVALYLFVAIPFPLTGAWSGTAARWLFELPVKRSMIVVLLGILTAGVIVLGITQAAIFFPELMHGISH